MADVLKRLVFAAGEGSKGIHGINHMLAGSVIMGVGGPARLETGIRVSGCTADHRAVRRQCAGTMGVNLCLRQHLLQSVIARRGDLINFMGGTETVEEMNKRHTAVKAGDL